MSTKPDKLKQARHKRQAARKTIRFGVPTKFDDAVIPQTTTHQNAPYFHDDPPTNSADRSKLHNASRFSPSSLDELLACTPEDITGIDLARINLLCAVGLQGSGDLDVDAYLRRLDTWAAHILALAEQHLHVFQASPGRFENSEPFWRISALIRTLECDFGIHYNPKRIGVQPDWADSQDMLIHGLLGPRRTGTCPSIPVLIVALGRRLGYPMRLVRARAHLFSRWDNPNGGAPGCAEMTSGGRGRFNIEFHGQGFGSHSDAYYYRWPLPLDRNHIERHQRNDPRAEFLVSLTPAQEFAEALCSRATVQMAAGLHTEAYKTYMHAARYDPIYKGYPEFARRSLRERAAKLIRQRGFDPAACRFWVIKDGAHLVPRSASGMPLYTCTQDPPPPSMPAQSDNRPSFHEL